MQIAPEYMPALQRELSAHRRRIASTSPQLFARIYLSSAFIVAPSRMHTEIFTCLHTLHERRGNHVAIAAPRGHAKSTVVTLAYVLWCLLYGVEPFVVVASGTEQQSARLVEHVRVQLESNPLLQQDFPELADVRRITPWRKDTLKLPARSGAGSLLMAFSSGQNLRGIRFGKHRPTLIVVDDIEDKQNVVYEEQRAKLSDWFHSTLLKAGSPDTNVIVVGTVLHHDALLANLLDGAKRPGWRTFRYQAVERFCDHPELWDQYSAIASGQQPYPAPPATSGQWGEKGAKQFLSHNREQMAKGAVVLWPQQYDYDHLMHVRLREGEAAFQAEFQNQPLDPQACVFAHAKLRMWDDIAPTPEDLLRKFSPGYGRVNGQFFGACDPSLGNDPHRGDYSAIVIVYVPESEDDERKTKYVLVADIARRTPDETIAKIVQYARIYNFRRFGVEGNQFQELMINDLKRRSQQAGTHITIEDIKSRSNKQQRIMAIEAEVSQGLIAFSRRHSLLLEQLRTFPGGKYDDGPDALEMAVAMANKPSGCWWGPIL
jgi:predicted phage terminase large subunit-like protein